MKVPAGSTGSTASLHNSVSRDIRKSGIYLPPEGVGLSGPPYGSWWRRSLAPALTLARLLETSPIPKLTICCSPQHATLTYTQSLRLKMYAHPTTPTQHCTNTQPNSTPWWPWVACLTQTRSGSPVMLCLARRSRIVDSSTRRSWVLRLPEAFSLLPVMFCFRSSSLIRPWSRC